MFQSKHIFQGKQIIPSATFITSAMVSGVGAVGMIPRQESHPSVWMEEIYFEELCVMTAWSKLAKAPSTLIMTWTLKCWTLTFHAAFHSVTDGDEAFVLPSDHWFFFTRVRAHTHWKTSREDRSQPLLFGHRLKFVLWIERSTTLVYF